MKKILLIVLGLIIFCMVVLLNIKDVNVKEEEVVINKDIDFDCNISLDEDEIGIIVNGIPVVINVDKEKTYDAYKMTTEEANQFVVCDKQGYSIKVNGKELVENKINYIKIDSLDKDNLIDVVISKDEFFGSYKINSLNSNINFTVEGESTDGYYYFDYNNAAVKTDKSGNVVFYTVSDFIRNFKRYEVDGEVYYGYLEKSLEGEYDNIDVFGCSHMHLIVMNEYYNPIDRVDYLLTDNGIIDNHSLENHDYQILGKNHYIVTAYVASKVNNVDKSLTKNKSTKAYVTAAVFQEIKDDKLVFEFNSTNYEELYEYSTDGNKYSSKEYQDYMHMNSVFVDPKDNNYIVSLRSMDGVIKLNHETGDIMWILGGKGDMFNIRGFEQFSRQHHVTISENGTLTVYDNGRFKEQSRLLEFTLDEENFEILDFNEFIIDDYYGRIRGSNLRIDKDEDIFLAAWGFTQKNKAIITEYNFSTDEKIIEFYDGTKDSKNYRVHKFSK